MTGLSQVLGQLQKEDARATESIRKSLMETNKDLFNQFRCSENLDLADGRGVWAWEFLDPCRTLSLVIDRSPGLQQLYESAWARSPPSLEKPWRIVVGFDEYVPGNKLSTVQSRKSMVVSFSFLELGSAALMHGSAWLTCVVVRSTMIAEVLSFRYQMVIRMPERGTQSLLYSQASLNDSDGGRSRSLRKARPRNL